jgi:hypothetical protein
MRKTPLYIAGILLVIQIARVAHFSETQMRAGALGWLFSMALAAGVFVCAYYTRQSITRKDGVTDGRDKAARQWAWASLILLVVADGFFNLADVLSTIDTTSALIVVSGCIYGAFPTLASAMLGALQGKIDRLPAPPNAQAIKRAAWVRGVIARATQAAAQKRTQPVKLKPGEKLCEYCGAAYRSKGAHMRYEHPELCQRGATNALTAHGKVHKE